MHREYHAWWSPRLERTMELLVFGHAGARAIVFPTRAGRFFDYENWGLVAALRPRLESGALQLYCVDSVDAESLYAGWRPPHERIRRHAQYEAYVLEEVIPLTFRLNQNHSLIATGCSLGAYHALNIALRHPLLFSKVVALSGRYDLTAPVGNFTALFDGHYDDLVYYHTPSHFIPRLSDPRLIEQLRGVEIILAVGEEDPFLENNVQISTSLWEKGVWNALHRWPGEAHRASHWRKMVTCYL